MCEHISSIHLFLLEALYIRNEFILNSFLVLYFRASFLQISFVHFINLPPTPPHLEIFITTHPPYLFLSEMWMWIKYCEENGIENYSSFIEKTIIEKIKDF
jgi:hypothetical protein